MKPKYQVGDKVRIKDKIPFLNSDHPARKYAGAVMTVRKVVTYDDGRLRFYRMEEDKEECRGHGWIWYDHDISGYAEDFEEPLDDSAFPEITFEELLASTALPERRTS